MDSGKMINLMDMVYKHMEMEAIIKDNLYVEKNREKIANLNGQMVKYIREIL